MPRQEPTCVISVPDERIQARRGWKVTKYIRRLPQQPVGNAARCYCPIRLRPNLLLPVAKIDITPPGLCVADESQSRVLSRNSVESLEAHVRGPVFKVHQDRGSILLSQLIDYVHFGRIALDRVFHFADSPCTSSQILPEHPAAIVFP